MHDRRLQPRDGSRGWRLVLGAALTSMAVSCDAGGSPQPRSAPVTSAPTRTITAARDDAPPARQLAAWLEAFNAGDPAALRAYQEKHFASGAASADVSDVDRELALGRGTARFDLRKTESSTPTRVIAVLGERSSNRFVRATMEVDPDEPDRVTWFQLLTIATPDELRPARMSEGAAIEAIRTELGAATSSDRFSGAVLVAKNGEAILTEALGFADRERKVANQLDTRFRIGSMNKMFTAVAILQLVQAGKLELSALVGKILPGYAQGKLASTVTIHHLLTHTGGTGDFFGPKFDAKRLELRTIADYVNLHAQRELRFAPGSLWEYSNHGFILLGAVIERVTGSSYYDWVSSRVYGPAGMTSTAAPIEGQRDARRSIPYTRRTTGAPWVSAEDTLPYRSTSAGGGDSTVRDLLRFAHALTSHELLDAKHTAMLTTGKVDTPMGARYAYGFNETTTRGVRCVGHGGGAPGMNGYLGICDSGYTVAVLANLDAPAAFRLAAFILDRLPAK